MNYKELESLDVMFKNYEILSTDDRRLLIRRYVEESPGLTEDDDFACALLLIAAIGEGTDPSVLSTFLKMPYDFVEEVAGRMTTAGLWLPDGSVDYEFLNVTSEELWEIGFILNVSVAKGVLAWTGRKKSGQKLYRITDVGRALVEYKTSGGSPAIN